MTEVKKIFNLSAQLLTDTLDWSIGNNAGNMASGYNTDSKIID